LTAIGRDPAETNVGYMADQLDRQVSGNEFSGLVDRTRPIGDIRLQMFNVQSEQVAPAGHQGC